MFYKNVFDLGFKLIKRYKNHVRKNFKHHQMLLFSEANENSNKTLSPHEIMARNLHYLYQFSFIQLHN